MKFMLLMNCPRNGYEKFGSIPPDILQAHMAFMHEFARKLSAAGELVAAHGLAAPTEAKLVRMGKNGKPATDGVFAESKEYLAGFMAGIAAGGFVPFVGQNASGRLVAAPQTSDTPNLAAPATEPMVHGTPLSELCKEERWKYDENPLDAWDRLLKHADEDKVPDPEHAYRFKFFGLFHVAPAQDSFMLRLRVPGCELSATQLHGLADLADEELVVHVDVDVKALRDDRLDRLLRERDGNRLVPEPAARAGLGDDCPLVADDRIVDAGLEDVRPYGDEHAPRDDHDPDARRARRTNGSLRSRREHSVARDQRAVEVAREDLDPVRKADRKGQRDGCVRNATRSLERRRSASSGFRCVESISRPVRKQSTRPPSTNAFCVSSMRRTSGWTMIGSAGLSFAFGPVIARPCRRSLA